MVISLTYSPYMATPTTTPTIRPSLPTIVFLHGFMGSSDDFSHSVGALSDRYLCISPSLHGGGSVSPTVSLESIRNTLSATLPDSPFILVGYSMGGRMALDFAVHYPNRVSHLILISASPGIDSQEERLHRRIHDETQATLIRRDFTQFLSDWYRQDLFIPLKKSESFLDMVSRRMRQYPDSLATLLIALSPGSTPSLWDSLYSLPMPLSYIYGTLDHKYTEIAHRIKQTCPNATLHAIPHCGHAPHLEHPPAFLKVLQAIL
jgi:2-succinyl-6-hydroxy-2,4-cyclohexadiene-1-carboxylate synthase